MKKLLLLFILTFTLFAQESIENSLDFVEKELVIALEKEVEGIDKELKNSVWLTRYSNFLTHQELSEELNRANVAIAELKKRNTKENRTKIEEIEKKKETIHRKIELLGEFTKSPFTEMIKPPEIEQASKISNPFAIISGFSYIKQLHLQKDSFFSNLSGLEILIQRLEVKKELLEKIVDFTQEDRFLNELEDTTLKLNEFKEAKELFSTTFAVYEKKVNEATIRVTSDIKEQIKSSVSIAVIIFIVSLLAFFLKFASKRYIEDNERLYMTNKVINFINITLIVLILLFAYIENVTYLVTVVGFASAGLAIAMKDMFMSLLGWIVIMIGGSFHVGNRIKVQKDGVTYVGDIIDISLLRMTVFEDITLTSYMESRRSGRIVFIPNNYIFTTLISNYTHLSMKTVWDGIDVTITFDSNHKKAMYLIKTIAKKYSKGYTDIARKQLNLLRNQYSLKNTNVEPRIFSILEPHGLTISIWYMTNSYAALSLRSTISAEIIDMINETEDIAIAFPTQTIQLKDKIKKLPPVNLSEELDI
ncbi:MAG: mechanosensitive ion channel domain-containing protein [Sulfurospirillaceae bacterium]